MAHEQADGPPKTVNDILDHESSVVTPAHHRNQSGVHSSASATLLNSKRQLVRSVEDGKYESALRYAEEVLRKDPSDTLASEFVSTLKEKLRLDTATSDSSSSSSSASSSSDSDDAESDDEGEQDSHAVTGGAKHDTHGCNSSSSSSNDHQNDSANLISSEQDCADGYPSAERPTTTAVDDAAAGPKGASISRRHVHTSSKRSTATNQHKRTKKRRTPRKDAC